MKTGDLIALGLIIGAFATVGVLAWFFKKRGSPQLKLRRLTEPKIVLRNLERREIIRDREGNIKEIVIHREVERVE